MPSLQSVQAGHFGRRNFQRPPWFRSRFPMSSTKPCLPPWGLFSGGQPCRSHTTGERLYQFTRATVVLCNKHPQTLSAYDSNIYITHEAVGWLTRMGSAGVVHLCPISLSFSLGTSRPTQACSSHKNGRGTREQAQEHKGISGS